MGCHEYVYWCNLDYRSRCSDFWDRSLRPLAYKIQFAGSGTSAEQITFLETVMPWLDTTDWIQRYAYFGVFNGSLVDVSSSGAAVQSQLGQVFDVYYNTTVSVTMTSIP